MKKLSKPYSLLFILGSFYISLPVFAVTATPTLSSPANNQSNWLFNSGQTFSWNAIAGATFRIVVSKNNTFSGFTDMDGASTCNSTCITKSTVSTSLGKNTFSDYWWKEGTYYWRVRAFTPAGGTSAWSATRTFTTTSLPGIVTSAIAAAGNAPQSIMGGIWLTDMAGGDGNRIRNAITTFSNWVNSVGGYNTWVGNGRPVASNATQTAMRANLNTYVYNDQTQWIEKIRVRFAGAVPIDDNGTLSLLQIRAQCKEFADRMVSQGAGVQKTYGSPSVGSNVRPGMYAFKNDNSHAGIITEVKWDNAGVITTHIAESNWGVGWSNPGGQVPWSRTVAVNTRDISMASYYAVATN